MNRRLLYRRHNHKKISWNYCGVFYPAKAPPSQGFENHCKYLELAGQNGRLALSLLVQENARQELRGQYDSAPSLLCRGDLQRQIRPAIPRGHTAVVLFLDTKQTQRYV